MATSGYMFESGPMHMTGELPGGATMVDWHTDIDAGEIKAALTNTSPATHYADWDHFDDVTGELSTAGGYTAEGLALTSPTVAIVTDADKYIRYDADDLTWAAPFTAGPFQYIVIYKDTGTASTSPLICYHDCGAAQTGGGGAFTYQFSTPGGVFRSKIPHSA